MSSGQKKTNLTTMSKSFYIFPNVFPQSPLVGVNFLEENGNVIQKDPFSECRKQFFKVQKKWRNLLSEKTLSKLSPGQSKTVLTNQPEFFRQKSNMFSSQFENNWTFSRFCEKEKTFFKNVLWTQTKQFWPPCQIFFLSFQTFSLKVR